MQDYKELSDAIGSSYTHLVKTNQGHTDEVKIITKK